MIPTEVADLAELIWPQWNESDDEEARSEVLASAWRIYNAGWRKPWVVTGDAR